MDRVLKLDNELYAALYCNPPQGDAKEIWERIRMDKEALKDAVTVVKNKWNEEKVKGEAIAEQILLDYETVDKNCYETLITNIYKYPTVAKTVLEGSSNGGYSFLLMSLYNPNLKLSEEQKSFAVSEALNKENPCLLCPHGFDAFDIRYWILKSANWTKTEKQVLINDFWHDDEDYTESLNFWEWRIINDYNNLLEMERLYDYTYEELLKLIKNHKCVAEVWTDINFCRLAHKLRPANYEKESNLSLKK